ncbi:hypothetical protein CROQUDRAFT_660877 [Cronartium quercuum f. sp. fusiforme G11]|uniref:Uncharacterized protein n=1 Tax=Cronartium quercuum f. sp. fusiforme G11 TaxID=708437 RepID=A0A9P6NHI3_9BASI|nr:hypothetical protein CROQUDRAFT_660877 [Cronartium quercuum f. sp. fusiforme G11]
METEESLPKTSFVQSLAHQLRLTNQPDSHHQHSSSTESTDDLDYSFEDEPELELDSPFQNNPPHQGPLALAAQLRHQTSWLNNSNQKISNVQSKSISNSGLLPDLDLTPRAYSSRSPNLPRTSDSKSLNESPLDEVHQTPSRRPSQLEVEPDSRNANHLSFYNQPTTLSSSTLPPIRNIRIQTPTTISHPPTSSPPTSPTLPPTIMSSRSESDELDWKSRGLGRARAIDDPDQIHHHHNLDHAPVSSSPSPTTLGPSASSESSLQVPITPEALLHHVRQMRLTSRRRYLTPTASSPSNLNEGPLQLPVHNRAGSNTSLTFDDNLSYSIHSPQFSTVPLANDQPISDAVGTSSQSLTLLLPEGGSSEECKPMAETLDLSHKRIADLTQTVVEELAEYVERLALGYNYLPVLPDHFAILGESLRYLNLRGNHMEIFPEVLTRMPSLEILDVSRNKIKAFPRRPGSLDRLRVLSVSRNRIRRLPNYVANLSTLRVLKLDHNPIVWPPRDMVTFVDASDRVEDDDAETSISQREDPALKPRTRTPSNESSTVMAHWLRALQDWMRKNPYVRPLKSARPSTGDPSTWQKSTELPVKNFSAPRLVNSSEYSPILTPDPILSTTPSTKSHVDQKRDPVPQHNRNASSSSSSQWVRKRPDLRLKKSLPDLRRNHAEIMVERRADADRSYSGLTRLHNLNTPTSSASASFLLKSPSPQDRGPHSAQPSSSDQRALTGPDSSAEITSGLSPSVHFQPSDLLNHDRSQVRRIKIGTHAGEDRLAGDRNSGAYFRRLSMLPASTISKEVPIPLLKLVDAIRGILFSLSQIYAALKQFVVFATQDRLPGALSRVMSAADDSMSRLINSLDRFDSSTRRSQPEGEVVQEVLVCCRDNVTVFGKLVHVLSIQLKVLTGSADVRYSRTLLLTLYGATAEIAMSWSAITPLVDDVVKLSKVRDPVSTRALQREGPSKKVNDRLEASASPHSDLSTLDDHQGNDQDIHLPKIDQSSSDSAPPFQSPSSTNFINGLTRSVALSSSLSTVGTNRPKGRRHAGSFSVEDVQLGAILPPASAGLSGNFPTSSPLTILPSSINVPALPPCAPLEINRHRAESSSSPLSESIGANGRSLRERSGSSRVNNTTPTALGLPLLTIGERDAETSPSVSPTSAVLPLLSTPIRPLATNDSGLPVGSSVSGQVEDQSQNGEETDQSQTEHRYLETQSSHSTSDIHQALSQTPSLATSRDAGENGTFAKVQQQQRSAENQLLSRTDQDFLDMTEATINIAVSVSSMMLENLGQARNSGTGGEGPELMRRERRPGESAQAGVKVSKATELKELCEIEMEVIKRLRASLAQFWASRAGAKDHPGSTLSNEREGELSEVVEDGYQLGLTGDKNGLRLKGQETRRVYEDATAFVKAVIQTANLARATMTEYPLSKAIREGLGELTKATKELATLLAVSSFKPTTASNGPIFTAGIAISVGPHPAPSSTSTSYSASTPFSPAFITPDIGPE